MKQSLFIVATLLAAQVTYAQSWQTTGNSGLTASNYLGTNDAVPLIFKVNNQRSGYMDVTNSNTSFGYQSLLSFSGGASRSGNSAFGYQSLRSTTNGTFNTAVGQMAMYSNSGGGSNAAVGVRALYTNKTGSFNTGLGNRALYSNSTGNNNTAIGNRALYSNTTGYSNIAIGVDAMYRSDTASNTVAIGDSALYNNVGFDDWDPGSGNVAVGSKSMYRNSVGSYNTAVGFQSLISNGRGCQNVAIGYRSLYSQNGVPASSANWVTANVAVGYTALYKTSGYENAVYNTGVGAYALQNNTDGGENSAFGMSALLTNTVGYGNTGLGYHADVAKPDLTNATALGYATVVDASNKVRVGNTFVTSIGGQVGWTAFSDGRYKKDIKENVIGLKFINSLKPVTYTVDVSRLESYLNNGQATALKGAAAAMAKKNAEKVSKIVYSGFIAQEVEAAANKLAYDFSGVDKPATKDGLYGLRYDNFVVPLVKAVQELSGENEALKSKNEELEKRLERLEALIAAAPTSQMLNNKTTVNVSSTALSQNVPNPFNRTTTINYTLPDTYTAAIIIITDKSGKTLKEMKVFGMGKGSVQVDATSLASGAYQYALYANGKLLQSKQMLVSK